MSKKHRPGMAGDARTREVTADELLERFSEGLNNLQALCKVYDGGYAPISLPMTTEVHRLLTENNEATKLRGKMTFSSPDYGDETRMLNALHRLVGMQLEGDPPSLRFVPTFFMGEYPVNEVDFRTWWNRDVVYRASAALPGTPAGLIPVNGSPEVPFAKRFCVSRRQFIETVRNKMAAHQETDLPVLLDEIDETNGFGSASFQFDDGRQFSTDDGTLPTIVGPVAAMIRQIVHELLIAYGRDDPPPPPPS